MKLEFTGETLKEYHNGAGINLYPGDTVDVDEHEGERFLADFPDDFKKVGGAKAITEAKDKAVKGKKNK